MSTNTNFDQNEATPVSTGSSGLMVAVTTGLRLLRIGRLCSPLGIAGFILPLALIKNFRLIHVIREAADRVINRSRHER